MELSSEKKNHVKLTYVLLDVVARHLRDLFVNLWDKKYPNEKWQDDIPKRNLKLQSLLVKDTHIRKILYESEQNWDLTTLTQAILDSGLKLTKNCRPTDQRSSPLLASEEIEIIKDIQVSFFGHVSSMLMPEAEFKDAMRKIKSVARNIFSDDVKNEIEDVESFPITPMMTRQVNNLLQGSSI